jgi:hypothetical protein
MFGLFFKPEEGGNVLLQNVGKFLSDYMVAPPRELILHFAENHLRMLRIYVLLNIMPTSELNTFENVSLT